MPEPYRRGASAVTDLLYLIQRLAATHEFLTAAELAQRLASENETRLGAVAHRIREEGGIGNARIEDMLRQLAALGVVQENIARENGPALWAPAGNWHSPEWYDNGEPPATNPPNADSPAGGDDGGAGGIREVLGHPILFALEKSDFDALLAGMFRRS
jgi:hypothetical protein